MQSNRPLLVLMPIILLVFLVPVHAQASDAQPMERVYWEQADVKGKNTGDSNIRSLRCEAGFGIMESGTSLVHREI